MILGWRPIRGKDIELAKGRKFIYELSHWNAYLDGNRMRALAIRQRRWFRKPKRVFFEIFWHKAEAKSAAQKWEDEHGNK